MYQVANTGAERDLWGTPETGHSCLQANHSEVHEDGSFTPSKRPEVGNLSAQSRRTDLGLRRAYRSPISSFDRSRAFFIIELRVTQGDPRRRDKISDRFFGLRVPLREATPYGHAPKYLIRDNDSKFGPCFARMAATSAIEILKTPYHAKRPNAVCERFLRSVRQECASPPVDLPRETARAASSMSM